MNKHIWILLLLFSIACSNNTKTIGKKTKPTSVEIQAPPPSEPYPHIDTQRNILANKPYITPVRVLDSLLLISSLAYLTSDECEGRRPNTVGHENARNFIVEKFRNSGIDSLNNGFLHAFEGKNNNGSTTGYNYVGKITGTTYPEKYIIITAHYDHLGKREGKTFYGTDDNASGTACLIALAHYFKQHPPKYSLLFAALDREEGGLEGAYQLVEEFEKNSFLNKVVFNLNMDMIARSDKNEIFMCGLKHNPSFAYAVDSVQYKTNVKVLKWHDDAGQGGNWTTMSDHAAFHKKQIPFFYIGVEDHPDYHKPSDTFDKVNQSSYLENSNMIAMLIGYLKP